MIDVSDRLSALETTMGSIETVVDLPALPEGTTPFTCTMGMYSGTLRLTWRLSSENVVILYCNANWAGEECEYVVYHDGERSEHCFPLAHDDRAQAEFIVANLEPHLARLYSQA